MEAEEILAGGRDSGVVVRIGSTVRRSPRPWTPSVHAFLRHLQAQGFPGAPRVVGFDGEGREVLQWIPGVDGRVARCYDDASLVAAARLIRELHRASASFVPPRDAVWRPDEHAPLGSLVCHGDLNPANAVYRDGRLRAFIDWDHARPTTALWDLAYAVRTFVPLYAPVDAEAMGYPSGGRGRRLRAFCDAYGLGRADRERFLPLVRERLAGQRSAFADRCRRQLDLHAERWRRALLDA